MTDNFRKDFTAGIPLQITKHISRMVSGCLLAVGGTMNEVNSLIIANLLAANGSYLVWDYDRKISEATKGIMETKGYKIYEIDVLEIKKYTSCIELIVRKPKMFFDDKVVIYMETPCPHSTPKFIDMLLRDKYLYGQHLTLLASGFDPEYSYLWDNPYDESQMSAIVHIDSLDAVDEDILDYCKYKLFMDNHHDSSISYLNKIIPAFASFNDVYLADCRDPEKEYSHIAADVKILEGFRDMEKDDCLFVEDGKSFIFDEKKVWAPAKEEPVKPDYTGTILTAALIASAACLLLSIAKRK